MLAIARLMDLPAPEQQLACELAAAMLLVPGDLNLMDQKGDSAIMFAGRAGSLTIGRLLVEAGARCDLRNHAQQTLLMLAAAHPDPSLLGFLLGPASVIDAQDYAGNTALHCACEQASAQSIALLLEHGANGELLNDDGKSPSERSTDPAVLALLAAWTARPALRAAIAARTPWVDPMGPNRRGPGGP